MAKKQVTVSLRKPSPPADLDSFVADGASAQPASTPKPASQGKSSLATHTNGIAKTNGVNGAAKANGSNGVNGSNGSSGANGSNETLARSDKAGVHDGEIQRADGRAFREWTVYLPVEVSRKLAMHCTETDRDVSNVLAEMVTAHLAPPVGSPEDRAADEIVSSIAGLLQARILWGRDRVMDMLRRRGWAPAN